MKNVFANIWPQFIACLLTVSCASGCSTPATQVDYSKLTLDEYVTQSYGESLKGEFRPLLPRVSVQIKNNQFNTKTIYQSFQKWCAAHKGTVTESYVKFQNSNSGYKNYGVFYNAIRSVQQHQAEKQEPIGEFGQRECVSASGSPIAAYRVTVDKRIEFFGDQEMLRLADEERVIKSALKERDRAKEQARQAYEACLEEESKAMRSSLKSGTRTAQGLVVELRPPIVSIQTQSSLVWMNISTLRFPSERSSCRLQLSPSQ